MCLLLCVGSNLGACFKSVVTTYSAADSTAAAHVGWSHASGNPSQASGYGGTGLASSNDGSKTAIIACAASPHVFSLVLEMSPLALSPFGLRIQSQVSTRFNSAMIHGDQTSVQYPYCAACCNSRRIVGPNNAPVSTTALGEAPSRD